MEETRLKRFKGKIGGIHTVQFPSTYCSILKLDGRICKKTQILREDFFSPILSMHLFSFKYN